MQAFRYHLNAPARRPLFGRRPPSPLRPLGIALAACGVGAGLWWGMPTAARAAGSLGALLERPADAEAQGRAYTIAMAEGEARLAAGELTAAVSAFDRAMALGATAGSYRRALDARYVLQASGAEAPVLATDARTTLAHAEFERAHGRLESALALYDQALKTDAKAPTAHVNRAATLEALGRGGEALDGLESAHRALPHDPAVTAARLQAIAKAGDDRRAIDEAIAAYRPDAGRTDDPELLIALADAYQRQGLENAELRAKMASDAPQLSAAARAYVLAGAAMRQYRRNPHWHQAAFDTVVTLARETLGAKAATDAPWRARAGRLLAEAFATRAQGFVDRSDFEAARVQLAHASAYARWATPEARAELHVQRAKLLPLVGRPGEAIAELEAALKLVPTHPCRQELARWQLHLGVGLLAAKRPQDAIKPLKSALEATPESASAFAWLVTARRRIGHASPLTATAHDAHLPLIDARVRLAEGLFAIGRRAEAEKALAEAAKAGASAVATAGVRAELALAHGQRNQARAELLKAIEHHATGALWARLGTVEAALAKADRPATRATHASDAREAFAHALAFEGSDVLRGRLLMLHKAEAQAAAKRGDWAAMHRAAATALVLSGGNAALALLEGDALVRLGRADDARSAYEAGIAAMAKPGSVGASLKMRLGRVALEAGRFDVARQRYQEALSPEWRADAVTTASAYYGLARACSTLGDREAAVEAAHQYLFWSFHDPDEARHVPEVQALESRLGAS